MNTCKVSYFALLRMLTAAVLLAVIENAVAFQNVGLFADALNPLMDVFTHDDPLVVLPGRGSAPSVRL